MTDYGSNFDKIGQKGTFDSKIHQMFAELDSKKQSDFKTFDEYNKWHDSIVAKYASCFTMGARQQFLNTHA